GAAAPDSGEVLWRRRVKTPRQTSQAAPAGLLRREPGRAFAESRRAQFEKTSASRSAIDRQAGRSELPCHHCCAPHTRRRNRPTRISWPPLHTTLFHSCRISCPSSNKLRFWN